MPKKIEKDGEKEVEADFTTLSGVGATTSKRLKDAGFFNFMEVATSHPSEIAERTGMGEDTALKVIKATQEKLNLNSFSDASEVDVKRKDVFYLTTGSKSFDDILMTPQQREDKLTILQDATLSEEDKKKKLDAMAFGFESCSIAECYGAFGSSKTQIAHQLCVNVQLPPYNGMAAYIDSEGAFRPDRIRQMAKAKGIDPEECLKKIKYVRVFSTDHQVSMGNKLSLLFKQFPIKVIVVDSMTSLFRSEFIGRGNLYDKQSKLNVHMKQLAKMADVYNVVVYVTNQVSVNPAAMYGDPTVPIGGHIAGHNSKYRIYLRKFKHGRIAKLIDAPHLADAEARFDITEDGVVDIDEDAIKDKEKDKEVE